MDCDEILDCLMCEPVAHEGMEATPEHTQALVAEH